MKTGEYTETYDFAVKIDPNLKGISEKDLQEQFELASKITEKTSQANEAVIRIRRIKEQLKTGTENPVKSSLSKRVTQLQDKLGQIEQELYQVKNQSDQDPLNFPIKLNNRLASLRRSVEDGDARPTDGAYKVFDELSAELDNLLQKLESTLETELPKINEGLKNEGMSGITVEKTGE
jgi:hypothetical protein